MIIVSAVGGEVRQGSVAGAYVLYCTLTRTSRDGL